MATRPALRTGGRYRLRAEAKEHFPVASPELRRGEAVDLMLQRKSRVVGTVLTPTILAIAGPSIREIQS